MDGADIGSGFLGILVGRGSGGRVHRAKRVCEPHGQVRNPALLCYVALAELTYLKSVVRPCAAGVALDFDKRLPTRAIWKCEPQVFAFWLALAPFCVHVADIESQVG